jgi:hypothetical protein
LASRHGPRWLADGTHLPLAHGSHSPLGIQGLRWISPSPWDARLAMDLTFPIAMDLTLPLGGSRGTSGEGLLF